MSKLSRWKEVEKVLYNNKLRVTIGLWVLRAIFSLFPEIMWMRFKTTFEFRFTWRNKLTMFVSIPTKK